MREREGRRVNNGDKTKWRSRWSRRLKEKGGDGGGEGTNRGGRGRRKKEEEIVYKHIRRQ